MSGSGPSASRKKGVHVVSRAKCNRAASVAALSEGDVCKRAKLEALGLLGEKSADDENALARDAVVSARSTSGVDDEPTKDDVEADQDKRYAPEHKEERSACVNN